MDAASIPPNVPAAVGNPASNPDVALSARPGGRAFELTENVGLGEPDAATKKL